MAYKVLGLILGASFLASYPGIVSAQGQPAAVAIHAMGGGVVTRVKTTAHGATVFVLSPSDQMFLVRVSQAGHIRSRQRLSDPRSFLATWPAHSPSEMMGLAVDHALAVLPQGNVVDITTGDFGGLHVWNLTVKTPKGPYLVRVDQASEEVIADTPVSTTTKVG